VFVEGLPASVCGGFTRQCLWRVYPPVFVEGLPASLWAGLPVHAIGWDKQRLRLRRTRVLQRSRNKLFFRDKRGWADMMICLKWK